MADKDPQLSAKEIVNEWRKGRISAHLRDVMLRANGHKLRKDEVSK